MLNRAFITKTTSGELGFRNRQSTRDDLLLTDVGVRFLPNVSELLLAEAPHVPKICSPFTASQCLQSTALPRAFHKIIERQCKFCYVFCFLSLSVLLNENFQVTFNGMVCDNFFIKSLEL